MLARHSLEFLLLVLGTFLFLGVYLTYPRTSGISVEPPTLSREKVLRLLKSPAPTPLPTEQQAIRTTFVILPRPGAELQMVSLLQSIERYYPFEADINILCEVPIAQPHRFTRLVKSRYVFFVNVKQHFHLDSYPPKTSCMQQHLGYHYMCRFMAGPVYWLPELARYKYMIRMDAHSVFTRMVDKDFEKVMEEHQAIYSWTIEEGTPHVCRVGFEPLLREINHKENWTRRASFAENYKFDGRGKHVNDAVFNCNFEVVNLHYFGRSPQYRKFYQYMEDSGLFWTTRLGDHEVKTAYLEQYVEKEKLLCFNNLPYRHYGESTLFSHNTVVEFS